MQQEVIKMSRKRSKSNSEELETDIVPEEVVKKFIVEQLIFTHVGAKRYEFCVSFVCDNLLCEFRGITVSVNKKPYSIARAIAGVGRKRLLNKIIDQLERHTKLSVLPFELPILLESK